MTRPPSADLVLIESEYGDGDQETEAWLLALRNYIPVARASYRAGRVHNTEALSEWLLALGNYLEWLLSGRAGGPGATLRVVPRSGRVSPQSDRPLYRV